jgi:hypothetical protein
MELYESDGVTLIDSSETDTDLEGIIQTLTSGQPYYLRCFNLGGVKGGSGYLVSVIPQ